MSRRINVQGLRQGMGLSIEQLAEKLGVHGRTVSRWENGHTDPSPLALQQLRKMQQPDDATPAVRRRPFNGSLSQQSSQESES